jgi:histidinol phosphatase-like PHP family hydrolase
MACFIENLNLLKVVNNICGIIPGQLLKRNKMKLDSDLHIHTYLSECCKEKERQTPSAILSLAEDMGVNTIGFADHLWVNPYLCPSEWYRPQDENQITRLRADLASVSTGIRFFVGCEAEMIASGKFGITPQFADKLDFVLLACSHFHMDGFVEQPKSHAPRDIGAHMLEFFLSGVSSGLASSIAHPLLPIGYIDHFDKAIESISDTEFLDVFGVAHDHGVALEITTGFLPSLPERPFSIETPIRFLSLAQQAGCKFTLGTDAHSPEAQKRLPELAVITHGAGITEEDMLFI